MKKRIYSFSVLIIIALMVPYLSGCSDWLDIKPREEEEAVDKFSSLEGFQTALAGCYFILTEPSLYGREMTFGAVDVLGHNFIDGPNFGSGFSAQAYSYLFNYNFENALAHALTDNIWTKMYEAIANVNLLLHYTEENRSILPENFYEIIRGEAIALRAFMHFDLLRLYAPHNFTGSGVKTIPYVEEAKPQIAPQLTTVEFVKKLREDINTALQLLEKDPIYTGESVPNDYNAYFKNREYHLNYYAVQGLKARMEYYVGDNSEALKAAQTVISAQKQRGLFPWVRVQDVTHPLAQERDRVFSTELLFTFNIRKLNDYINTYFTGNNPLIPRLGKDYFQAGDYRREFIEEVSGNLLLTKFHQKNETHNYTIRDRMPGIRISEMYLIVADILSETNLGEATDYLNSFRKQRGLSKIDILNKENLKNNIETEYYKEFLGEGQYFFYHKRKGTRIISNVDAKYVLLMPDSEIEWGQREEI